jgi:hypothetical protein
MDMIVLDVNAQIMLVIVAVVRIVIIPIHAIQMMVNVMMVG